MLVCPPLMLMAGLAWPALLTPHCFFLCTLRQLWGNISAFTSEPRQEHVCPSPFVILRQSFSCCPGTLCSGWPGTRRYTYLCLPGALPLWLLSLSLPGKACRILLISRPQRLVRRLAWLQSPVLGLAAVPVWRGISSGSLCRGHQCGRWPLGLVMWAASLHLSHLLPVLFEEGKSTAVMISQEAIHSKYCFPYCLCLHTKQKRPKTAFMNLIF